MNLEQALKAAGGSAGYRHRFKVPEGLYRERLYPPATIHKALALMAGEDFETLLDAYWKATHGYTVGQNEATRTAILAYVAALKAERDALLQPEPAKHDTHGPAVKHINCENSNCPICVGGLFQCSTCGAAEAETDEFTCVEFQAAHPRTAEQIEKEIARLQQVRDEATADIYEMTGKLVRLRSRSRP